MRSARPSAPASATAARSVVPRLSHHWSAAPPEQREAVGAYFAAHAPARRYLLIVVAYYHPIPAEVGSKQDRTRESVVNLMDDLMHSSLFV